MNMIESKKVRARFSVYDASVGGRVLQSHRSPVTWNIVEKDNMDSIINYINNNEIDTIGRGEKVYFSKNAKISRAKFRQWAEDKNIKITYNPEKADILVLDKESLNKSIKKILNDERSYFIVNETFTDSDGSIYTEDVHYIYVEDEDREVIEKTRGEVEISNFYKCNDYHHTKLELEDLDSVINISQSLSSKKYIDSSELISKIGSLTLNEDLVDLIINQLKGSSNDKDLATEMLSNCRFKESEQYIAAIAMKCDLSYLDYGSVSRKPLKDFLNRFPENNDYGVRKYFHLYSYGTDSYFKVIDHLQETFKDDFNTEFWSNFIKDLVPFKFDLIVFDFEKPQKVEQSEQIEQTESESILLTEF